MKPSIFGRLKKKRHRKINLKIIKLIFKLEVQETQKYGWPGFAVSKMLLDSFTYEVDHLRTPLSLCDLLEKVTCILEMAYNNEEFNAHTVSVHTFGPTAAIETGANEEKHGFFMEKATIGNV